MERLRPVRWLAPALLLAACGAEKATTVWAELEVRAGPGEGPALSAIPFGQVPIGTTEVRTVEFASLQPVGVQVGRLRVEGADAASFQVTPPGPFAIPGIGSREVTVRFRPTEVRLHAADLVIPSDDPDGDLRIALDGEGVSGDVRLIICLPSTAEEPERCRDTQVEPPTPLDLGQVIEGQVQEALVTVFNDGAGPLQVTDISFADPTGAATAGFSFRTEAAGTVTVAPLTSVDFRVALAPVATALGAVAADVRVTSDDPDQPTVAASFRATAVENQPPAACVAVRQIVRRDGTVVDLAAGDPIPPIEPLDRVVLDARVRDDCSGDPEDGTMITQEWAIEGPGVPPPLEEVPGEPFRRAVVPELPGTHVVSLKVSDRLGKGAVADAAGVPATVSFEVVMPRDIGVYALWPDSPFVDLDLHFVHPASSLWTEDADGPSDCDWNNRSPNWGDPGTHADDPLLALDDQGDGALAEAVELDSPEAGARYQVHVHFAQDRRVQTGAQACTAHADCPPELVCSTGRCMPPVMAGVEIWLEGERIAWPESFANPQRLVEPCDDWFVGVIEWPATPGGTPAFLPAPSGTVAPSGFRTGTFCGPPQ